MQQIVIAGMARTPIGSFQGALATLSAPQLGAVALAAALQRAGLSTSEVDEVIMGCVLAAGQGQAPARQAALAAGLPDSVPCTTINKMCGSGMKAVMLAHDSLLAGSASVMLAGGMESMSNAPYLLPRARQGLRLGHAECKDHLFLDGLEDAYDKGKLMGVFAELCGQRYGFSRQLQDEFALLSLTRAQMAMRNGSLRAEIVPVTVNERQGSRVVESDEAPLSANPERIAQLKPVFQADGTVTAANASSISDGAAALLLMTAAEACRRGVPALARIVAHSSHAQAPSWFTTAPVGAIQKLLAKTGWSPAEVDLFEINEAFAVVTMAAIQELGLDPQRVNVHGGACALGHPIGASGARIIVSLVSALQQRGGRRGVASLCIGGGEACAVALELL
ncbi:acetyl-CoA C-acyltransferase [Neisseriaceae bacterium TC5R-5]|nr:acetyl-CoA C-acyltransferase [Neisseriaceae bacterium TC5R-5]